MRRILHRNNAAALGYQHVAATVHDAVEGVATFSPSSFLRSSFCLSFGALELVDEISVRSSSDALR